MTKFYLSCCRYLTVLFVFAASMAVAQSRTVTGKVTSSDDGSGIPGVNILEKGTSNGTVTDANGGYTINVSANSVLVFSFVGYVPQEVAVGAQTTLDVSLVSDVTSLDEVVVVGYGTQEKKEITSSVASVKSGDFNRGNVNDPAQLLAGKVAGLSIVRPGSDPNGTFNIRLRGLSTVGANSQPLIIIDGVLGGSLNLIDPNDIESMDVLKDGSAAAIYGSRGSSGVILITTKSGKAGKMQVEYNGFLAAESVARKVPVLSASEFRAFSEQQGVDPALNDRGSSTDWFKEITRKAAISQVHNLSLAGATKSNSYRLSVNFRDVEGIQITSGWDQINTRLNLTQKALDDKLKLDMTMGFTRRRSQYGFSNAFRYAAIYNPTAPVKDASLPEYGGYYQENRFDYFNPVALLKQNTNEGTFTNVIMNVGAEYQIMDGLRIGAHYSLQNEANVSGQYFSRNSFYQGYALKGIASRNTNNAFQQLFESTVGYDKTFGSLEMNLLGGYSYQEFINEGFGVRGSNFITDAFNYNNLGASQVFASGIDGTNGSIFSYKNSNKLIAFFGRANFNYNDTYFLSASLRREGSSKFGANNKWGNFPAVSGGVTLSNLFEIPQVNSLKLRAGYGVTGNQPVDSYLSLFRFSQGSFYPVDGQYTPGYRPSVNQNPDLKWETKTEINVGIDASLFDSKIGVTLDYFTRKTTDLILFQQVPVPPNFADRTWLNGGEINNSGFEFAINYNAIQKPDFNYTTSVNLGTIKTEIISLNIEGGERYQAAVGAPGQSGTPMILVKEGGPVGQIVGPKLVGIGEDGTRFFLNKEGQTVPQNQLNIPGDYYVLGQGLPDFTFGWNNSFRYKNFDLNFLLRGAVGHSLVNSYRVFYESPVAITSYNVVETAKNYGALNSGGYYSSNEVEKADYLTLDNATFGYNLPLGPSSKFSKVRFYLSGQNLFLITKYNGVDPEVRYGDSEDNGNPLSPGIDRRDTWVRSRTITLGVNVGF